MINFIRKEKLKLKEEELNRKAKVLDQKETDLSNLEAKLKGWEEQLILQDKKFDKENNTSNNIDITMYASPGLLMGVEKKRSSIVLESPISSKYSNSHQTPLIPKKKGRIFELRQNVI